MNVLQGKNRTKVKEWEQYLSNTITYIHETVIKDKDPQEKYMFVMAKAMVGCFIGLIVK